MKKHDNKDSNVTESSWEIQKKYNCESEIQWQEGNKNNNISVHKNYKKYNCEWNTMKKKHDKKQRYHQKFMKIQKIQLLE